VKRTDLVRKLRQDFPHIHEKKLGLATKTIFEAIAASLEAGGRAELRGFGSFSTTTRVARPARNPRTGEEVSLKERRAIRFKPGADMYSRLNG